ncbi:His-Xaa-Ser system radical SAM maturase HxsC [Rhizobium sp. NLR12b]|uniref:His-Xaa-Ser system radical SAM maturase HxsC n=1 Tax=Rhizobium sp. NLR12b TaxID=2731108 RepID=UPI001C82B299|nr:His-Xaa-Ser system radical SAM maturase HxsC [Rhizobium sp. NLR12b]MBX5302457.1 His-Xaa-Ser system radical SAM maturase HxsC [Rhizobium sp. NLR12b]
MLQLSGFAKTENLSGLDVGSPIYLRLVTGSIEGKYIEVEHDACLYSGGSIPEEFEWVVTFEAHKSEAAREASGKRLIVLPDHFGYLRGGDVLKFTPGRDAIRALYRTSANANYFLLTERCNHYCLMCSQPPKDIDDSWLGRELKQVLPLLPSNAPFVGLTGGEPTLLGDDFFEILSLARNVLPETPVHILSNGRAFHDFEVASRYANVKHPHLSVGIPLYSADPEIHDYVVQSKGAFDETVRGILNLKALGQNVEVRVVVHKQTYAGLVDLSEFIFRNLTFVDHVTFMGLEITGFTRANMDKLWIDPFNYRDELGAAVRLLATARMNVSVYNHQLCLLDPSIHQYSRQSISDWKNEYVEECGECKARNKCGGFFASSKFGRSNHIIPYH